MSTDVERLSEKSARDEFTRVADVCLGCRRCVDLCDAFPTLFDFVDRTSTDDAGGLTPHQQDVVSDSCFQCGRCVVACPYAPAVHEAAVDVSELHLHMVAMRHATGQISHRARVTTWLLTRGRMGRVVRAPAGSLRRRLVGKISDLSPTRRIGTPGPVTFATWFAGRATAEPTASTQTVTVFPTCVVDREALDVGRALVEVYERNGHACVVSNAGCCGAPWLHAGDVDSFTKLAKRNVAVLAAEIRRTGAVVVAQPRCLRVLTHDTQRHVKGVDAAIVAEHTFDACAYLIESDRTDGAVIDTGFVGDVPSLIAFHVGPGAGRPEDQRAGRDLMRLTGAEVETVERDAGVGVTWGWRQPNEQRSMAIARRLADELMAVGAEVIAGADHHDNIAILEQTGVMPRHPLEIIADAYRPHKRSVDDG